MPHDIRLQLPPTPARFPVSSFRSLRIDTAFTGGMRAAAFLPVSLNQ
ncbi:hypothetical protein SAMN06265795_107102 [Noviherbaspirillum humi]|uniref:Uncharacterized protein n=1 Tax=Noviherbaspirillum humi TaxID=1688639 RepID=A0A239HPZ4_9BURK|nr:hypothetical protein [Noviherbaspirillum humi]SNS83281.1 hypothetical protein SAMN06265795_107102 [Noviherbaspirillum humi]